MANTTPIQVRSVDAYGTERFTSGINRQMRVITGGTNCVFTFTNQELTLPEDCDVFPFWKSQYDSSGGDAGYDRYVHIGPGVAIVDDVVIHVKAQDTYNQRFILDINDAANYLTYANEIQGPGHPPEGSDIFLYYIVLLYQYSQGYPPSQARYYLIKNKDLYFAREDDLLFLGCVGIQFDPLLGDTGQYYITGTYLSDYDSVAGRTASRKYPTRFPTNAEFGLDIDGGWFDTNNTISNWIDTSQTDSSSVIEGGLDYVISGD